MYSPAVLRRPITILLIATLVAQSLLGLASGSVLLCLGGADSHGSEEAQEAATCVIECGHQAVASIQARTPVSEPASHCDDGCGCTDLELTMPAWYASSPTQSESDGLASHCEASPPILADGLVLADLLASVPGVRDAGDDPVQSARGASLRTTRLLI